MIQRAGFRLAERIITERLILAKLEDRDAEEIFYGYASKAEATRFVSWPTHKRIEDTRDFLAHARQSWTSGLEFSYGIRLRASGRFTGSFGVINENGKVQFGYILNPSQWGNGYATEACVQMMRLLRGYEDIYRVWTLVDTENVASIRVLEKAGLQEEVRLEKWMRFVNQNNLPKDCILYRLPL